MASELTLLTDEELRKKLRLFNLCDGPITKTTRKLFEFKLAKAMGCDKIFQETKQTQAAIEQPSKSEVTSTYTVPQNNSIASHDQYENTNETCKVNFQNKVLPTFYGVCLPPDSGGSENQTVGINSKIATVFTDRSEALSCLKKNNEARFRAFSTKEEAEAFASGQLTTPIRQLSHELSPSPVEPVSKYKGPKQRELTIYRKLIEKGDVENVSKTIYCNPRYLISSSDTPVIIQEGCHYNSLHVAAKAGQRDVCELIVDSLNDVNFWRMLNTSDSNDLVFDSLNARRKAFVLDLYLNTPDKAGCETPLHFASKFGKADTVKFLLSCPGVDKSLVNKDGKTAQQIICTRVSNCSNELCSKIHDMFDNPENVFVPILRSEDNCSTPKVGTPWSPCFHGDLEEVARQDTFGEMKYKVSAFAGPMSPQEAKEFCGSFRLPKTTPDKMKKFRNIRRSDSEKGLERVARKLAKSQNVPWSEYWTFLDGFADFSTSEGLLKLEQYLKTNSGNDVDFRTPVSGSHARMGSLRSILSGDDVFDRSAEYSPPFTNGDAQHDTNSTPYLQKRSVHMKNFRNRLNLIDPEDELKASSGEQAKESSSQAKRDASISSHEIPLEGKSSVPKEMNSCCSLEALSNSTASPDNSVCRLNFSNESMYSLDDVTSEIKMLDLSESSVSVWDSRGSTIVDDGKSQDISEDFEVDNSKRMDGHHRCLFIEGLQPTKEDLDVFRVIKDIKIDPCLYPYTYRWCKVVRSYAKTTREAWPSPASPRYQRTRKYPKTWSC